MQGDRGEDAAGADDEEFLRCARRDDGLQGGTQVGTDGKLIQFIHRTVTTTQEAMRQTDRAQREAAR